MTTPTPPATRPRNPEAERLHELARNRQMPDDARITTLTMGELRAALAAERRNVVAEIRERLGDPDVLYGINEDYAAWDQATVLALLDEVAGLSDD